MKPASGAGVFPGGEVKAGAGQHDLAAKPGGRRDGFPVEPFVGGEGGLGVAAFGGQPTDGGEDAGFFECPRVPFADLGEQFLGRAVETEFLEGGGDVHGQARRVVLGGEPAVGGEHFGAEQGGLRGLDKAGAGPVGAAGEDVRAVRNLCRLAVDDVLEAEHELAAALGVAAVHFGEGVEDVLDGGLVGIAAEGIDGVPCGFAGFGFVAGLPPAPGDPMDGLGGAAAFREDSRKRAKCARRPVWSPVRRRALPVLKIPSSWKRPASGGILA